MKRIPKQNKELDDEKKEEVNILLEKIEEDDDVQNVFQKELIKNILEFFLSCQNKKLLK